MATPPTNTQRAPFDVGLSEISGSTVRQIREDFKDLEGINTVLPGLIGTRSGGVYLSEGYKHEWIKSRLMPHEVALSSAFTAASDTTLTLADANVVMDGQILFHGNQAFYVTSHASDTVINVTKSYLGTTAVNIASGQNIAIGLPHSLDTDSFPEGVKGRGTTTFNYPMVILEKLSESDLRSSLVSYLTRRENDLEHSMSAKRKELDKQLEVQLIYGIKQQPTDANRGSFDGIRSIVTTNVTAMNDRLDPSALFDMLDTIRVADDKGMNTLVAVGKMNMKRVWNALWRKEYGQTASVDQSSINVNLKVDKIMTDWGDLEFLVCDQMPEGELWLIDPADMALVEVQTQSGSGWMEHTWDESVLQKRGKELGVSNVLTFEVGHDERHGRITDITMTGYPGLM